MHLKDGFQIGNCMQLDMKSAAALTAVPHRAHWRKETFLWSICPKELSQSVFLAIWRSWIRLPWFLFLYNSIRGTSWLGQCSSQVWCRGLFPGSVGNHSRPTLRVHWRQTVLFFHWLYIFTCIARLESVEKTEWKWIRERRGFSCICVWFD